MTILDVRKDAIAPIDTITFSDTSARSHGVAYQITQHISGRGFVRIQDSGDFVLIESEAHARNLIKALEAAIELEWLK